MSTSTGDYQEASTIEVAGDDEVVFNMERVNERTELEKLREEIMELRLDVFRSKKEASYYATEMDILRKENEKLATSMQQERSRNEEKEDEIKKAKDENSRLKSQLQQSSDLNKDVAVTTPAVISKVFSTQESKKKEDTVTSQYDVPMPRCSVFDGKGSWEGFIRPFRSLASACGWDDKEKHFRLTNALRGDASEFAFTQLNTSEIESYEKLEKALETRFKEQRTIASYLADLENRKLGQKEKLSEYVADIQKLVLKGFPSANIETRETINLRYFLKGLSDQNMAVAVGMKDPKTIEEAKKALETYKSLQDEVAKSKIRAVSHQDTKNVKQEDANPYVTKGELKQISSDLMKSLDSKFESLTTSFRNNRSTGRYDQQNRGQRAQNMQGSQQRNFSHGSQQRNFSHIECYRCHEMGHFARDCTAENAQQDDRRGRDRRRHQEN